MIRVRESMEKYIQVEPRELKQVYGTIDLRRRLKKAYDEREVMAKKIENRERMEKHKADAEENDWWEQNGRSAVKLSRIRISKRTAILRLCETVFERVVVRRVRVS